MSEGLAERKAARGGFTSTEHRMTRSTELGIANLPNWRYLYKWTADLSFKLHSRLKNSLNYISWHDSSNILKITLFLSIMFYKSTRTDKNAYWETTIVCVKM